ncbi:general secretion pathway protein J [Xenophilus aerolatus]|nr:general secretion pathway protein J [Xenophilus aerolatus]
MRPPSFSLGCASCNATPRGGASAAFGAAERRPGADARASRGFTLVELLVALAVMALLALVSWRGLEAMARAQSGHRERDDAVLVLQTAMAQWTADLDAATAFGTLPAMDWDGRVLRLTRRSSDGTGLPAAAVVAWTLRPTAEGLRWMRWQSPPLVTQDQWQQAWQLAANWAQDGTREVDAAAVAVLPLASWTLAYFRNNTWTQPVGAAALGLNTPLPDGVRLVLDLPPGAGLIGQVSRDWVRPTFTVQRGS